MHRKMYSGLWSNLKEHYCNENIPFDFEAVEIPTVHRLIFQIISLIRRGDSFLIE